MIEIAEKTPEGGIFQKDIAVNQELPNKYLDHIIHALKVAGLIRRIGHRGGYVLTKEPSEITILDIHSAFEPGISIIDCLECTIRCPREHECASKDFWLELNETIVSVFKRQTLSDLIQNKKEKQSQFTAS